MIAHYTTMANFLDYIKPCGHLRLSSFSKLNDPYEYKQQITGTLDDCDNSTQEKINVRLNKALTCPPEATSILLRKIKAGCFVFDSINPPKIEQASFWNNPPMWTHYGDRNKGIILVFRKVKFLETVKKKAYDAEWAVEPCSITYGYKDLPPPTNTICDVTGIDKKDSNFESRIAESLFRSHKDIWFHKDKKWAHESEYRIILFSKEDEYTFIPIQESLIAVVLGADSNEEDFDEINDLRKKGAFSLYKSKYDIFNLRYEIELVQ